MWPWQSNGANHAPMHEPEPSDAFKRRLDELNERQDRQERVIKDIRLEWDEVYDKMRLLFARLSKRMRDAEPDAPEPAKDAPQSTIHPPRVVGAGSIPRRNY
jgi:uncharacterized coiled-coil protein SlyX